MHNFKMLFNKTMAMRTKMMVPIIIRKMKTNKWNLIFFIWVSLKPLSRSCTVALKIEIINLSFGSWCWMIADNFEVPSYASYFNSIVTNPIHLSEEWNVYVCVFCCHVHNLIYSLSRRMRLKSIFISTHS